MCISDSNCQRGQMGLWGGADSQFSIPLTFVIIPDSIWIEENTLKFQMCDVFALCVGSPGNSRADCMCLELKSSELPFPHT